MRTGRAPSSARPARDLLRSAAGCSIARTHRPAANPEPPAMRRFVLALAAVLSGVPALAAPSKPAAPAAHSFTLEHALTLRGVTPGDWSRDGSMLAFTVNAPDTSENTSNQDVWLWDAATNRSRPLTRSAKNDYAPQFSPSGDTLAFLSNRDNDESHPAPALLPLRRRQPRNACPT